MEMLRKSDADEYFSEPLLQQIEQGNNAEILSMLKDVDPCQLTNCSGATLLHFAAKYGNTWLSRYLIDLGANIDAQNHSKETPLMFAIENCKTEIVKLLLKANADIFVPDHNGKCALRKAFNISRLIGNKISMGGNKILIDFGKLEISENIVKILFDRVTIESLNISRHVDSKIFHVDCPLYMFIPLKNAAVTRVLLEKGSPVDVKHPHTGETALHTAVKELSLENVKVLLEFGADVNMKRYDEDTPLACLSGSYKQDEVPAICSILLEAGASLFDRDRGEILAELPLLYGNKDIIRTILNHKIDLHFMDASNGHTVLHYLAKNKNPDVLEELRGSDFDVNIRTRDSKWTMLHIAALHGNATSIRFLLDYGADVNATCRDGQTPLSLIIAKHFEFRDRLDIYIECIEILLARGADPRIVTVKNHTSHWNTFFQPNSETLIKMMKPVLIHLSALQEFGLKIGKMRAIISLNPQFEKVVYSKKAELKVMKEIKLDKSITLLDFLFASDKNIALYARTRRMLISSVDAVNVDCLDPCYQRKLHENFRKFSKLIELRKNSAAVIDKMIGELYNISVYNVAEKIVDYLEDRELCKLLGVVSHFMFFINFHK